MAHRHPTIILLGIALVAFAATADAAVFTQTPTDTNTGNGGNSGPNTYAILVGSDAPADTTAGGPAGEIRGKLDVDNVAARLSWATEVISLKYDWSSLDTVAADIQGAANDIGGKVKAGDMFIFYYSGHGTGGSATGVQDFLNPVSGAGYQDNVLTSVFDNKRFASVNKIFMIDACHADGMWKNDTANDRDLQMLGNLGFIGSSSENGVSYADTDLGGTSYFTNALLPAITPTATYGKLLASAMSAGGQITGYLKGGSDGLQSTVGRMSPDFNPNLTLSGLPVPEPASLAILFSAAAAIPLWRRCRA